MMSGIRGTDTKPELIIRKGLHALGWRYRLHDRRLPGSPDLVFRPLKAVIFVNGCFWHGHDCHLFKWPKSRPEFWREKISGNIRRDYRVRDQLLEQGWRICVVHECMLKGRERMDPAEVILKCEAFLRGDERFVSIGRDQTVTSDEEV